MKKEWTGKASIRNVSEGKVTPITQVVCSHSLELISNLLMKCWTFSLAMDMSTLTCQLPTLIYKYDSFMAVLFITFT